ncbi:MAG: N-acetylmuramoyl-L-alanine amidase [Candidatus Harrisonbacteria bacterium]|nr:N-acetylmuramoyl-L-alanine amidase [Candidatus Harrisonbacteria bacterium]
MMKPLLLFLILLPLTAGALVIYPEIYTSETLKNKYEKYSFRVLIVPGHDDETKNGAVYRGLLEADLNVKLAQELKRFLETDPRFQVILTRDENGYQPYLVDLFQEGRSEVTEFRDRVKKVHRELVGGGLLKDTEAPVAHVSVSSEDSIKLYGINYWVGRNSVDLVLHVHFNDYPGRLRAFPGKYTGFAIYTPDRQLPNGRASGELAKSIFERLKKYFTVSDFPKESTGIIEDPDLIALGASGSLYNPALLIEYGYIYETQFIDVDVRPMAVQELAYQTFLGIKKYLDPNDDSVESSILPYIWRNGVGIGLRADPDIFALQLALMAEEVYGCGPTGNFFNCTHRGVIALQKKYGISPTGFVGPKTLELLNSLY